MKIAHIGIQNVGYGGGVQRYIQEIGSRHIENGHELLAYTIGIPDKNYKGEIRIEHVNVPLDNMRFRLNAQAIIYNIMAATDPAVDIIHYHSQRSARYSFIPKSMGKKTVFTVHGSSLNTTQRNKIKKMYRYQTFGLSLKANDSIVIVGRHLEGLVERFGIGDYKYIPHGADVHLNYIPPKEINKYNLKRDSFILHVGRIEPIKGADILINAFKKLETDKKLVIAGRRENSHTDYMEYIDSISKGDDKIIFTGNAQGSLLNELYNNASFVCLPNRDEGITLTTVEAMGHGKCVILSDAYSEGEQCYNHAIRVEPENIEQLKNEMKILLDNPEKAHSIGKKARDFVAKNHIWDSAASDYEAIYQRLLEES